MRKGIEALIEGLYVEAIMAGGGPSPGGKGHGYPSTAFKNSGPSPDKGHWLEAVKVVPERDFHIIILLALQLERIYSINFFINLIGGI